MKNSYLKKKIKFSNISLILNDEHDGSEALETVILSPLMFITFVIILYFFFMSLTFISYSNLANSIAQELNMRQSGYKDAISSHSTMPEVWTYRNGTGPEGVPSGRFLPASSVAVSPNTTALKSGTYFALDKHKDQFVIPFSEVKGIKVYTTNAIDPAMGKKLAGTIIRVEIEYTTMIYGKEGRGLIPMTATGYNIIA